MTEAARTTIEAAAAGNVYALELWSREAVERVTGQLGFALPPPGRTAGGDRLRAIRVEPAVWLLDGPDLDGEGLEAALGEDGALTAIGGGLVRVRIAGPGWRALLMADGVFDAEDPAFVPGCAAATIIAHVAVRLHVIDGAACELFVPASFSAGLLEGWSEAARTMSFAQPAIQG